MEHTYTIQKHSETHFTYSIIVAYSEFEKLKEVYFKKLSQDVELKGFRKGQAPRSMVEPLVLNNVINRALEVLLPETTSEVLKKEGVDPASQAKYTLKEINKIKGVIFDAELYVYCKFSIPDLSKIKIKLENIKIEKIDIDKAIENILNEWNEHNPSKKSEKLTMDIIKELGFNDVKTLEDFNKLVEDEMIATKRHIEEQKKFTETLDEVVKKAGVKVPENIIDNIKKVTKSSLEAAAKEENLTVEKYLEKNKTTAEKFNRDLVEKYLKDVKNNLFLSKYGRDNDVKIPEDVMNLMKKQYTDAQSLYQAVERLFLDLSANHLWNEIKKANGIVVTSKKEVAENA